jgi:hypothetical protein
MIRSLNGYLKRLSPRRYALTGGLVAFITDTAIFLAQGRAAGMALGKALVVAGGVSAACVLLARRFADAS